MRTAMLTLIFGMMTGVAFAQEKNIQTFDGTTGLTTPLFQVQNKWELRWDSPDIISVTLLYSDGTVVAGTSGSAKGSLYQPRGGSFYLQITRASGQTSPWHLSVVEIGAALISNPNNSVANYLPPASISPPGTTNIVSAPATPTAAIPTPVASTTTNASPVAPTAPPSQTNLTTEQAKAVVVIKGDVAEGTGFLVHAPDGPAVVTNLHVLSANPNVRILTTGGAVIKTLSLKGASDRDLAMFMIQDDHYSYLDLATDIKDTVQPGDETITPGNSEGGEVVLNTKGKVLGIGPDSIEFDNPIYHGNSGGPVFHTNTGKVLAVVTRAEKVNVSDELDKASFQNKNSAITSSMRYFGLRIDTVPRWETYDWNRYLSETTFLDNFRIQSRCLDSYMNGARYEKEHLVTQDEESGPPDSQYYLRNDKIQSAQNTYHRLIQDADTSQRLDASRELVMELEGVASTDMDAIQNADNFYSFDRLRAADEVKYRKALILELEKCGDKISDLGH